MKLTVAFLPALTIGALTHKYLCMNSSLYNLFDSLNQRGIKYFLLTDFESDFRSNDIDLYVNPDSKTAFESLLFNQGWFKRKEPSHHVNHHFYISPASEVYLDVKYSLTFAGSPTDCFTYNRLSQNKLHSKLNSKGVLRPTGLDAIVLYAAHLAYRERGKLEKKHSAYLSQYIDLYRHELDSKGIKVATLIDEWLETRFPEDTSRLREIIAQFFTHSKQKMTRSSRLKYGYGLSVLFLGTDGSGKTTLVKAVNDSLNLKTNKLYLGSGEDNWTSPRMRKFYDYEFKNKALKKLHSIIRSYFVLPLELSLRVLPVFRKSKYHITLIDRFPGFVFLDNKKLRLSIYKLVLPKPDLVFFLYASPEVLVKRKPNETTIERSLHDIKRFEKVANVVSNGNYKRVDTSNLTVEEARNLIMTEIYKHPKVYSNLLTTTSEN